MLRLKGQQRIWYMVFGAKSCEEKKSCAWVALEQVLPSYKQWKGQDVARELHLAHLWWRTLFQGLQEEGLFKEQEEHGFQSLSKTGRRQSRRWKSHAKSEIHIQPWEAEMSAARALQEGSIVQKLQQIGVPEKLKNTHCPHNQFWQTCGFSCKLWCWRSKEVPWKARKNASYTSKICSCCWTCRGSWHMGWRKSTENVFIKQATSALLKKNSPHGCVHALLCTSTCLCSNSKCH